LPSGFKPWRPGNQLQKHLMTGGIGWLDINAGLKTARKGRDPRPMRKRPILSGTSDTSMIYRGQEMKNSQLEQRLSVLEDRHNADLARDEAAEVRRFLDRLSDQELNRCAEIAERSEAGISPTVEEQSFLDDLEAKYGHDVT
jgi:hypothetical protein